MVEGEGKRLAANPRRAELLDLMLLLMLLLLLLVLLVGLCVLCWWRLGGRMEGYAVLHRRREEFEKQAVCNRYNRHSTTLYARTSAQASGVRVSTA